MQNKSAQSNLGTGRVATGCPSGPWAVRHCAVACIHECACYAGNFAAKAEGLVEQSLRFCYFLINPNCDLETEYIVKKPTNRAFQGYVCRTEMLSIFRIRIGNISPSATQWHFPLWKWRTKNPKPPLPLGRRGPHLIQQCLGPPHAPPQTATPTVEVLSHTYAVNSPLDTMARPKYAPKSTPSRGPIPKPHHLLRPWTRPTYDAKRHPDPIRRLITMHWTDAPTHRPTDRQTVRSIPGKFDESDAA